MIAPTLRVAISFAALATTVVGGDGTPSTAADIVEDAQRLRPKDSEVMRLVCDAAKLRERTGWQPRYTLADGLRQTIGWFGEPGNLARYRPSEYNQ